MASSARYFSRPPRAAPLLVGREREQRILRDALDAAIGGWGRLVLISGEAGIGKTALAESVCDEAETYGARALVGRCYDLTETPPYGPWLDLFARWTPTDDDPPLPIAFAARGTVGTVASPTALFNPVRDFFAALASRQPVVLLLDDLHWADPASLDLLRFLTRELATLPLLLIATYRADEVQRDHPLYVLLPTLAREAHAERIGLRRLEMDDVRALVAARYALAPLDEARLVLYLHTRTAGNAFFMVELLHALEEARTLRQVDGRWLLGDLLSAQAPPFLRQVIDGRLARLGEPAQRLLAAAAVIGQEVPLALWATVTGEDEETLLAIVERAAAARVIEETANGSGVTFVHALIRETLYEGTLAARRRGLHRTIAEALLTAPEPDVDVMAYHLNEMGDPCAPHWLTRAGRRAQRAWAWQTAAKRYIAALALLPDTAAMASERGWLSLALGRIEAYAPLDAVGRLEEAERLAARGNDRVLAAVIVYYRSLSLHNLGDVRGSIAGMEAAVAALRALTKEEQAILRERQDWIGRSLAEDDGAGQLALFLAVAGRLAEARPLIALIVGAARPPTEPRQGREQVDASLAAAIVAMHDGMPEVARQAVRQSWQVAEDTGGYNEAARALYIEALWINAAYWSEDADARARLHGDLLRAWQKTSVSLMPNASDDLMRLPFTGIAGEWAIARRLAALLPLGSVTLEIIPRSVLAPIAYAQGETDLAWRLVHEVLPDGAATAPGGTNFVTALVLQRLAARLAMDANDLAAALQWVEAHDRWLAWSGATPGRAEGDVLWAPYHRAADPDAARRHAEQALTHATAPRQPLALLAAHRLLGELATDAGRFTDAADHLGAALALATACAAPYERALTLFALASLHAATGNRTEADAALQTARAIGISLGAMPLLDAATTLAASLASDTASPSLYPCGLTAREVEILRLVAEGLTDSQIAERLFLSRRTVGAHLGSIYTKLGVASRAAATRFALAHHLGE